MKPDAAKFGSLIRRGESIAKPLSRYCGLANFVFAATKRVPGGENGAVVIFNHQVAAGRNAAIRTGWNDGAWGRPRREVAAAQATWYEQGYAGGLVFRQKQELDLSQRSVASSVSPRIAPAA